MATDDKSDLQVDCLPLWQASGPYSPSVSRLPTQSAFVVSMGELDEHEQLPDQGRIFQGAIVTVNLYYVLNNPLHALETLSEVVRKDKLQYLCVIRDLMQDLVRKVSSSINSLRLKDFKLLDSPRPCCTSPQICYQHSFAILTDTSGI